MKYYIQISKKNLINAIGSIRDTEKVVFLNNAVSIKKVNKEDKYGNRKKLTAGELLVFLFLHKYTDENGNVNDLKTRDLSNELGLTQKTIRNCLHGLQAKKYIIFSFCKRKFAAAILNFAEAFKKDGPGYLKISHDKLLDLRGTVLINKFLNKQFHEDNGKYDNRSIINQLRLKLRTLLILDQARSENKTKKMVDILKYLPKYFFKNNLKKMLKSIVSFSFSISLCECDDSIELSSKETYDEKINEIKQEIANVIAKCNMFATKINTHINNGDFNALTIDTKKINISQERLLNSCMQRLDATTIMDCMKHLSKLFYNDMKKNSLDFNQVKDRVGSSIEYLYNNYIYAGREVKSYLAVINDYLANNY